MFIHFIQIINSIVASISGFSLFFFSLVHYHVSSHYQDLADSSGKFVAFKELTKNITMRTGLKFIFVIFIIKIKHSRITA